MTALAAATLSDNTTTYRHVPAHNKCNNNNETENRNKSKNKNCNFSKSICNMKYIMKKSSKHSNHNNCKGNSENSRSNICGNLSCKPSLSLFYCSCLNSSNSIITNAKTTIRNCWWWYKCWPFHQQQQQKQQNQKQYKPKLTYIKKSSTASLVTDLDQVLASNSYPTIVKRQKKRKPMDYYTSLKWYNLLLLLLSILAPCTSLSMTEVRIPKHIMRYETASLGCKYDLDGESLYSVKWYKDGFEFYRYVPRDNPPGQVFPLPGVDVDLQNSTDNVVVLNRVTLQSTGRYRCEVSGEAPSFQTVSGHEDMTVVVTPSKGPQITGGQPRYSIGEKVSVNCTSAPSKPICHLSWLINGVHANRSYLRYYEPKIVGREGLEVATLGLEFRVRG